MDSIQPLSILLYGDFRPGYLASSYRQSFERLGHRVIPINALESGSYLAPWVCSRLGHRLTIRSLSLRRAAAVRWNQYLLAAAGEARVDLIFIFNGDFIMPETLASIRSSGARIFIFHADNPFPPHYASRPETLPCALESDCYFIWSRFLAAQLKEIGVRRTVYLPFGWDSETFPYTGLSPKPAHDVVFIGGWDRERERFLEPIARAFDLKIWGPAYWGTRTHARSPLRRAWQGRALSCPEAAQILTESKVVLNILRHQNLPDGVIMRTFEVPGCGGFQLSTRTAGAQAIFPEGSAGAYFNDVTDCTTKIENLLNDERRRVDLARNAHEIVRSGHQYSDRARQIIESYYKVHDSE